MDEFPEHEFLDSEVRISEGIRAERQLDGSVIYEVTPDQTETFRVPLDGRTVDIECPPNPPIRIIDGRKFPQLDAPLILVQFEVFAQDCRKGWCPIGGEHYDGELYLGDDESTLVFDRPSGDVCVWGYDSKTLELERTGTFPLYVRVRAADDTNAQ